MPQVVAQGLAQVVVFEDDVRFESNFRGRLERLMEEVEAEKLPWDLMYEEACAPPRPPRGGARERGRSLGSGGSCLEPWPALPSPEPGPLDGVVGGAL